MVQDYGNSPRSARRIRLGQAPSVFSNTIGRGDRLDFLALNLTSRSRFVAGAGGTVGLANLSLLDRNGRLIRAFQRVGRNQSLNLILQPGRYYLRVAATPRLKGLARYTLRVSAAPQTAPPVTLIPPPTPPPITVTPPPPPPREDIIWSINPPGANQIPEGFFLPAPDAAASGVLPSQGSTTQVFLLSQILDSTTLTQLLDSDGADNSRDDSNFPFIEFGLSGLRRLSRVEIEKVGATVEGSFQIRDYRITLFISNDGRGGVSTGSVRLPDAEFDNDNNLNTTDITRVLLDGLPFEGSFASEWLYGSSANDVISGNNGDDYIFGGAGNDVLSGGNGDDYLNGGSGNDRLDGGSAEFRNVMRGSTGDDYYIVRDSNDQVYEQAGTGTDTVEAFVNFDLSDNQDDSGSPQFVETLILAEAAGAINGAGSSERNTIIGNSANNALEGDSGDDLLDGRGGNDILIGDDGRDTLVGGDGADIFAFDSVSEGVDVIRDFQLGVDRIRIYQNYITNSGFVGTTRSERVFYNENTGNLSFGLLFERSTVFVQLEPKPTLAQLRNSSSFIFSPNQVRADF